MTATARLAALKPSSCRWLKVTADGEWLIERGDDDRTTWLVASLPGRMVVADYLGSLEQCRAYIGSGQAQEDLDLILAHGRGEHGEADPGCRECGLAAELAETEGGKDMTDTDKMVSLGDLATRDGIVVPLHRDYEDLMLGSLRLTPEAVAALEDRIAEWKQQASDYILRADEAAAGDSDIPELCAFHGGDAAQAGGE